MADRLLFSKTGRAKYISHLDLMRTFQRAFARAGIQIKHTEGFNPHPFVSIALQTIHSPDSEPPAQILISSYPVPFVNASHEV